MTPRRGVRPVHRPWAKLECPRTNRFVDPRMVAMTSPFRRSVAGHRDSIRELVDAALLDLGQRNGPAARGPGTKACSHAGCPALAAAVGQLPDGRVRGAHRRPGQWPAARCGTHCGGRGRAGPGAGECRSHHDRGTHPGRRQHGDPHRGGGAGPFPRRRAACRRVPRGSPRHRRGRCVHSRDGQRHRRGGHGPRSGYAVGAHHAGNPRGPGHRRSRSHPAPVGAAPVHRR